MIRLPTDSNPTYTFCPLPTLCLLVGFASCESAWLRVPVSSYGPSRAPLWSGNGRWRRPRDRQLRNSPRCTNDVENRRGSTPSAMESIPAAYWIISPRAAITECPCCRSHRVTPRATEDGYHSMPWREKVCALLPC